MCFSKHLDILTSWLFLILVSSLHNILVMFIERELILISFTEVQCFLCCETTKKVQCRVHDSVISQNLKKLDGSNNRLYAPAINSEESIFSYSTKQTRIHQQNRQLFRKWSYFAIHRKKCSPSLNQLFCPKEDKIIDHYG